MGKATALLMDTVKNTGEFTAFVPLMAAMERADEITREVRGKRTDTISASSNLRVGNPEPRRPEFLGATGIKGRDAPEQADDDVLISVESALPLDPDEFYADRMNRRNTDECRRVQAQPHIALGRLITIDGVHGMTDELNAVIDRELPAGRGAE